jgi:cation transport ATPase
VQEVAGAGLTGKINDQQVCIGTLDFVLSHARSGSWFESARQRLFIENVTVVAIAIDAELVGWLLFLISYGWKHQELCACCEKPVCAR